MSLFKYYPPERVAVLNDFLIRYTPPNEFNDALDSIPVIRNFKSEKQMAKRLQNLTEAAYIKHLKANPVPPVTFSQFKNAYAPGAASVIATSDWQKYIQSIISRWQSDLNDFGVFCLCKNDKSPAMWAHYAAKNQGFLIEFDSNHEFFSSQHSEKVEVIYENKRVELDYDLEDYTGFGNTVFQLKSKEWEYEQEVRYIRVLTDTEQGIEDNQGKRTLFLVPSSSIVSVTVGLNTKDETIKDIERALKKYPHIKGYHAEIDSDHFKIQRVTGLKRTKSHFYYTPPYYMPQVGKP